MEDKHDELRISITSLCNMDCVYCHNEGNDKRIISMSDELLFSICRVGKKYGISKIRLTGGEPLMADDIIGKCKYIHRVIGQEVSLNTNAVRDDILLKLIDNGDVDSIVVGIDYFDAPISKMSPIGKSSKEILQTVIKAKNMGCKVSVDMVFDENEADIEKMAWWAYDNKIRLKIIEKVSKHKMKSSDNYEKMKERVMKMLPLNYFEDDREETNGWLDDKCIISFFDSLCKNGRCDICNRIQMRVSPNGIIRTCLWNDNNVANLVEEGIEEGMYRMLDL